MSTTTLEAALLDKRDSTPGIPYLCDLFGATFLGLVLEALSVKTGPLLDCFPVSHAYLSDSLFGITSVQTCLYSQRFQDGRLTRFLVSRKPRRVLFIT